MRPRKEGEEESRECSPRAWLEEVVRVLGEAATTPQSQLLIQTLVSPSHGETQTGLWGEL